MSWVALDRGLRLADKRSFPADRERWLKVRDEIYEEVMAKGWDPGRKAFVQAYGSDALDASSLLMPLVFFMAPNDPRMLEHGGRDSPARRLRAAWLPTVWSIVTIRIAAPDGLPGHEGTFNMCSFWLVEALTRAGRTDPAGWKTPGCSSSRCSVMPTISASTPSRPATAARPWVTFPRRSRTWP